jgi:TRAP transporter TAXI family solute receptor
MKRLLIITAAVAPLALAGTTVNAADTFVRMISGPSGGSWYPYGAKMMEMAGKQIKGISTSNGPGGGVGNPRNLQKKKAEFGWTFANTAYDAYKGQSKFKKPHTNLRFFANLYPGVLQTVVPAKSNIRSYKDLANKRLSPGKLTFSGNIAVEKLLGLYGITYAQVKKNGGNIHRVGYKDSVALLKDGHIDAFVGLTTAPNSSFIALDFSPGVRFLPVSDAIADKYVAQTPGFIKIKIKAGTYKNLKEDIPTIAAPTVLITHAGVSNTIAYEMAKVIWDNHSELAKVNKFWNNVKLADALQGSAIPVHPGAMRFYREKGITK